MKQAILITAYRDFRHLADLVDSFDERFDVFIHLDRKSRVDGEVLRGLQARPQVKLVGNMHGDEPLARPLLLLVDLVVWALIALPGVAVGLLVARLRFDLTFSFDWPLLVFASLLVTTMATAVGYAIAVSMPPMPAQMLSQVLVFFVLLFSPITFPVEQLPQWFQMLHDVLPIRPAADLLRAGIAAESFTTELRDLLVLAAWTALGLVLTARALMRRR